MFTTVSRAAYRSCIVLETEQRNEQVTRDEGSADALHESVAGRADTNRSDWNAPIRPPHVGPNDKTGRAYGNIAQGRKYG